MKKVFTGPKVQFSSLNDTNTCLHQLCDYWDLIVRPELQQKITGSMLIDSAIHGLFPGDLIVTISQCEMYSQAVARAIAISAHSHGRDLLFLGFPSNIQAFWCEILAREAGIAPIKVLRADFNDNEWRTISSVLEQYKSKNSIFCSPVSNFDPAYLERKIKGAKTSYPDIKLILLETFNTNALPKNIIEASFGPRLKQIAIETEVSILVSISHEYVSDSSVSSIEQQLPIEWEIPIYADVMFFGDAHKINGSDPEDAGKELLLFQKGRTTAGSLLVPLEYSSIAQIKNATIY